MVTFNLLQISKFKLEMNDAPRSQKISLMPNIANTSSKQLTISTAELFFSGNTIGYLEFSSINVKIYLWPFELEISTGPTTSIARAKQLLDGLGIFLIGILSWTVLFLFT